MPTQPPTDQPTAPESDITRAMSEAEIKEFWQRRSAHLAAYGTGSNPPAAAAVSPPADDLPFPSPADDTFPPAGTSAPAIPWDVINQIHADTFRAARDWLQLDEVGIVGLGDLVVRRDVTSAIERLARPDDLRPHDLRERIIHLAGLVTAAEAAS